MNLVESTNSESISANPRPDSQAIRTGSDRNKGFALAVAALTVVWALTCFCLYSNFQRHGCTTTSSDFSYVQKYFNCDPAGVRLDQPFEVWIEKLSVFDTAWYMKAGLAFAAGHGISVRSTDTAVEKYTPYSWQGPGTSFLIGTIVKLFGDRTFPYFVFACLLHWSAAVGVMMLARKYCSNSIAILVAGLLSLLCLPVVDFDFGVGIVASELPIEPLFVLSLLVLQLTFSNTNKSLKRFVLGALAFGCVCGLMTYVRESYSTFALFSALLITIINLPKNTKGSLLFLVVAMSCLQLVQLPWKLRNERAIGKQVMSGSQYRMNGYGRCHWMDWKAQAQWCPNCGLGIGNYMDPAAAIPILMTQSIQPNQMITKEDDRVLDKEFAELARVVWRRPLKAAAFKFEGYDVFWLGARQYAAIRIFSALSLLGFLTYLWKFRGRVPAELYVFPAFAFILSLVVHYEPRYVYPLYFAVTPVCIAIVLDDRLRKRSRLTAKTVPCLPKPN